MRAAPALARAPSERARASGAALGARANFAIVRSMSSPLPDAVPLGEVRRALITKLRHHGDVLLASPVISVLKARAPRMEVDALVYDETAPMLDAHPALAQLHAVGRNWREAGALRQVSEERALFRTLRGRRYDLLVHLTDHARGAWLSRLLGVRYSVAPVVSERGSWWRKSFTHLYPLTANRHPPRRRTALTIRRRSHSAAYAM